MEHDVTHHITNTDVTELRHRTYTFSAIRQGRHFSKRVTSYFVIFNTCARYGLLAATVWFHFVMEFYNDPVTSLY